MSDERKAWAQTVNKLERIEEKAMTLARELNAALDRAEAAEADIEKYQSAFVVVLEHVEHWRERTAAESRELDAALAVLIPEDSS